MLFWLIFVPVLYVVLVIYDWWRRRPWIDGIDRKAVLITGCDSGFGHAAAMSLYARGVHVYAGCYTESGAKRLEQETGDRLRTVVLDVSNTDSVQKAAQFIKDTLPQDVEFWGVVNNAGVPGNAGPLEFLNKGDFTSVLEVNLLGMIEVTIALLPMLKKSKGRVVNVASVAGELPVPSLMPYCVSKHAAIGFSETLRVEKIMWDIKVSTIAPAFYRTNIVSSEGFAKRFREKWKEVDASVKEDYGDKYVSDSIKLLADVAEKGAATNLGQVVDCYEHALFSIHPRNIYHPGIQAKFLMFAKLLPSVLFDKMADFVSLQPKIHNIER